MDADFLGKPLNKIDFTCGDTAVSIIYGFLENVFTDSGLHDHVSYELHIFFSGQGHMIVEDSRLDFSKNTVIIIPPNTSHLLVPRKEVPYADMTLMFTFKRNTEQKALDDSIYEQFHALMPKQGSFSCLSGAFYGDSFQKVSAEIEKKDASFSKPILRNLFESIFLHILWEIREHRKHSDGCSDSRTLEICTSTVIGACTDTRTGACADTADRTCDFLTVKRIDEYIHRLSPDVTLSGLAEYINMSKRNTQRIIHKLYGKSFTEKLTQFRLKAAMRLINDSDCTLAEIARNVGYREYTSFHKAFLHYYGVIPSEYRKQKASSVLSAERLYERTE